MSSQPNRPPHGGRFLFVSTLGDNVTPGDRLPSYTGCYDSTWGGEHFDRTNPAAGDDEYDGFSPDVESPYETYFGDKAGFMEAALAERAVVGLVWFKYGFVPENGTLGAGQFPEVLDLHEELSVSAEVGGFGTELATGDVDGVGHDEIVVGRGAGVSMLSRWSVFSAAGTEVADPLEAFPGALFGVRLASGMLD